MKIFLYLLLSCITSAAEEQRNLISKEFWQSEAFLKEFNGSYGINANIEPYVSGEERAQLIAIQPLMMEGKRQEALKVLKASKFAKTSLTIQHVMGTILFEEYKYEEAIEIYKKIIDKWPAFRRTQKNIGFAYANLQNYEAAFPHLLKAVNLGGNEGSLMGLLGLCYQNQGRNEAALLSYRQAQIAQPDTAEWKLGTAFVLQKLGRNEEALRQYMEMEKEFPNDENIQLDIVTSLISLNKTEEAIIKLDVLRRKGNITVQSLIQLGTLHLGEGNVALGGKVLRKVLASGDLELINPALNAVRYTIDLGEDKLARELLNLCKKNTIKSEYQRRIKRLEAELFLRDRKTAEQGEKMLRELINSDPSDDHSLFLLGSHQADLSLTQKAIITLEQVVNLEGEYRLKALIEIAKAHISLKQYALAVETLKTYLEEKEDSNIQEYMEAIEELIKIRKGS